MRIYKILPIVGACSLASVAAPFITSCSSYSFEYGDQAFNIKDLNLKTKQLEKAPEEGKEIDFYFDHIYNDHQILVDDIAYSLHSEYWQENYFDNFNLSIKLLDNPLVNKHLVSLNIAFNTKTNKDHGEVTTTYSFAIKNLNLEVDKTTYENWHIVPKYLLLGSEEEKINLLKNCDSSAALTTTEITDVTTTKTTVSLNSTKADSQHLLEWDNIYGMLDLSSWYFGKM